MKKRDGTKTQVSVSAVHRSDGLLVKAGDTLSDGTTTLSEIIEEGGVSINLFGQVAFHGRTSGIDSVFVSNVASASE